MYSNDRLGRENSTPCLLLGSFLVFRTSLECTFQEEVIHAVIAPLDLCCKLVGLTDFKFAVVKVNFPAFEGWGIGWCH